MAKYDCMIYIINSVLSNNKKGQLEMSHEIKSKSSLRKTKSSINQNRIMENGKDITPLPFYPGVQGFASSLSLYQNYSSTNLTRSMVRSGLKRKLSMYEQNPYSTPLFSNVLELVPNEREYDENNEKFEFVGFDDQIITMTVSPVYTFLDICEFECDLMIVPKFSKLQATELRYKESASQFDNNAAIEFDSKSSDDEQGEDYESEKESATDTELDSVISSHYSYSTSRSTRRLDPQERYAKLEKKYSKQMVESLHTFQNFVLERLYFDDIQMLYKEFAQNCQDITLLQTIKPLQHYHGRCDALDFCDFNGLLFGLFVSSPYSSYIVIWKINEFFDTTYTQPLKVFHYDLEIISFKLDKNSNVIYCASTCSTILMLAFDAETQNCELVFDSRLLFDSEMHGLTHFEISDIDDTPTILTSNLRGQLLSFKVAKRMSSSVTAFYEPQLSTFIVSFCKFKKKLVLLGSDGTISIVDPGFTGQQCSPSVVLPSFATLVKASQTWIGILTWDSFLVSSLDFKMRSVSPTLPQNDCISDFTFNPCNDECVALITKKGKVFVYLLNHSMDEPKDSYFLPDRSLSTVSFTNNGHLLLIGDEEGTFSIFALN